MLMIDLKRRQLLMTALAGITALPHQSMAGTEHADRTLPLSPAADANGVRLPAGFSSRIVARSGSIPCKGSSYAWHAAPDGGACFATQDGGWIYVSNSEVGSKRGGAGALRFNAQGDVVDAYAILHDTSRNCAGGATPWGSWLSCEEIETGAVWECDPRGERAAIKRPALGIFNHEAVAVDPQSNQLYLTEDRPDGRLYRFTPNGKNVQGIPDLASGILEIARLAQEESGRITWHQVPDPAASSTKTRYQVPGAAFNGGEGIVYHEGKVFFTTKGDNRVWSYTISSQQLAIVYDDDDYAIPVLTGVDNITVSSQGTLYVAEDGGNMQIVIISPTRGVFPVAEMVGHDLSEITGIAFSPDGSRLYFSSQRGTTGNSGDGITYEIRGPFI
jgi:secreted PhoX family phosphatase